MLYQGRTSRAFCSLCTFDTFFVMVILCFQVPPVTVRSQKNFGNPKIVTEVLQSAGQTADGTRTRLSIYTTVEHPAAHALMEFSASSSSSHSVQNGNPVH